MLQTIRENSKGILAKIFIGLVIAVFALFGVETIVGSLFFSDATVSVDGVEITETEIQAGVQRRLQQVYANASEDEIADINESTIRAEVIEQMIQQQLIINEAENTGITVSSRSLDREIASTPNFQVDGVFDNARAQAVLMSAGFTPQSYRAALARDGMVSQLVQAYTGSGFITSLEQEMLASLSEQTRDVRYLLIDYSAQAMDMEVQQEEIETYYQENQDTFMQDAMVSVNYLELNKDEMLQEVEVSEEDIEARFQEEQVEFESTVERRASHILLEATTAEELDAAREQAAELKGRIDAGESFEDLAAEYSDDLGSADSGGDVGYTTGDTFVAGFEEALQSLEIGEVSDPVETEFGIHLIKLTESNASEMESLDEARERIREDLQNEAVDEVFTSRSERLNTLGFESFDLEAPAEALGLEIKETELFTRQGGSGIAAERAFIDAAFSSEITVDELNSELVSIDERRSVILHLKEYQEPHVRPLEEVRAQIQVMLRSEKVADRAREMGESILGSLNSDQNIDSLLREQGLEWREAEGIGRESSELSPQLLDWIFTLPHPESEDEPHMEGLALNNGTYAIVSLSAVHPGSVDEMEQSRLQSISAFVIQTGGEQDFARLMQHLESAAKIQR